MQPHWTTVVLSATGLAVALCAFFLALNNYRLTHTPVIQIVRTQASFCATAFEGSYHHFTVLIRNLGLPLHDIHMKLAFSGDAGSGWISLPLTTREGNPSRVGQFAKGMMTEFTFRTDRLDEGARQMLIHLRDIRDQQARLQLSSCGYRSWDYKFHRWTTSAKRAWNRLAFRLQQRTEYRRRTRDGREILHYWIDLPTLDIPILELASFIRMLRDPGSAGFPFPRPPQSPPQT